LFPAAVAPRTGTVIENVFKRGENLLQNGGIKLSIYVNRQKSY